MKKIYSIILIIICCTIGVIAIFMRKDNDKMGKHVINNPVFSEKDCWASEMFPDIPFDKESDHIYADIKKKNISLDDRSIDISLSNSNKGVGFYFYGIPAVEKLNDDKWERLSYKESDPSREQWCVCAIEESEDICFSTNISVDIDNINDFTEGTYRAVVFLTDRNIYVPFEVIGR